MAVNDPLTTDACPPELLQRVANGDETAFRGIYIHFFKRLFQFAFAIVKSREPAEDIIEDIFIRIWQHREDITAIRNLRVYLYTAVKNASLNYLSQKAHQSITEPFDHIHIDFKASTGTPEQILIGAEMHRRIASAVEALPPRCKMIFKLVREDGLKYKEIAEVLNISVNTVDVQMAIAIKKIISAIEAEFDFPIKKRAGK
jgi:RNA polymerase sigma-70 factor (family 1)